MKKRTILAALVVVAAGAVGVIAATSSARKTEVSAPATVETKSVVAQAPAAETSAPAVAGSVVFIDASGNKVQPTAKQLQELRGATKGTRSNNGVATVSAVDPNDPSKGIKLTNIPRVAAAARINADGTVDAQCFDNEAQATKFTEGAEVKDHSHEVEAAK